MKKRKKFYITTAIDYTNAPPHIGHAYEKICADIIARWHLLLGEDVFFLTGTDEHGQKIERAAKEAGMSPKEFVDKLAKQFQQMNDKLNISYSKFIRTTSPTHEKFCKKIFEKVYKNKKIYKGHYEGYYCTGCEAFKTKRELVEGKCVIHKKQAEWLSEESYFFKMGEYQKQIISYIKKNKQFIFPFHFREEILNRLKEPLHDLSVSRTSFKWGVPLPIDKGHIIYVWFDALLNYLSGIEGKENYWPADLHVIGPDILWFHAVIWQAILLSLGKKLPKRILVHGWLTIDGEKISKSLGNVIDPIYLINKYGADSLRYFLARHIPLGSDGDFSEKLLAERHNSELADKLGNLVSRVTTLAEKYGLEKCENNLLKKLKLKEINRHMSNFELDKALLNIFDFVDVCNSYIQEKQPWKTRDKKVLYELVDSIKALAILLWPFIPSTAEKIAALLDFEITLKELRKPLKLVKIKKAEPLFKKIENTREK